MFKQPFGIHPKLLYGVLVSKTIQALIKYEKTCDYSTADSQLILFDYGHGCP